MNELINDFKSHNKELKQKALKAKFPKEASKPKSAKDKLKEKRAQQTFEQNLIKFLKKIVFLEKSELHCHNIFL